MRSNAIDQRTARCSGFPNASAHDLTPVTSKASPAPPAANSVSELHVYLVGALSGTFMRTVNVLPNAFPTSVMIDSPWRSFAVALSMPSVM